jgi:hypothetical protein
VITNLAPGQPVVIVTARGTTVEGFRVAEVKPWKVTVLNGSIERSFDEDGYEMNGSSRSNRIMKPEELHA